MPTPLHVTTVATRYCVLGVDPALAGATGFGVVEFLGAKPRMLRFGALKHVSSATVGARLCAIHELIASLVAEFTPDAVAVEAVFSKINVGTALKLAEVRGVVLLAAAQASIPAHSYSPREVKSSVAGYGDASKLQMQQMVRSALGLCEFPEPADAADALAVALCHGQCARSSERMAAAMKTERTNAISRGLNATQVSRDGKARSSNRGRAARILEL
ncbi:MAG: crossover junction endodeoxyribonuclease RuvC [Candidatus Acidiferrales bacterium]